MWPGSWLLQGCSLQHVRKSWCGERHSLIAKCGPWPKLVKSMGFRQARSLEGMLEDSLYYMVYFIFLDVLIRCGSFGTAYAKSSWGINVWCIRVRSAYILCQTSAAKKMKTSQVPMHFQPLLLVHSEFASCHWLATSVEVNSGIAKVQEGFDLTPVSLTQS